MNSTLKQFYQEEWQSNPTQTIADLASKYGFEVDDLGDTSDWVKDEPQEPKPTPVPVQLMHPMLQPEPSTYDDDKHQLTSNITDFKKRMVKECLHRLRNEGRMLEVKNLRELAQIVDIIDKSLKATSDGQNVNVLIQNIVNKYGDDC